MVAATVPASIQSLLESSDVSFLWRISNSSWSSWKILQGEGCQSRFFFASFRFTCLVPCKHWRRFQGWLWEARTDCRLVLDTFVHSYHPPSPSTNEMKRTIGLADIHSFILCSGTRDVDMTDDPVTEREPGSKSAIVLISVSLLLRFVYSCGCTENVNFYLHISNRILYKTLSDECEQICSASISVSNQ